jgi:hypothetical protein
MMAKFSLNPRLRGSETEQFGDIDLQSQAYQMPVVTVDFIFQPFMEVGRENFRTAPA